MNESVVEVGASMPEQAVNPPPPLPPITHRRPRVREVSSRFMSPVAPSSSNSSPLPNNNKQRSSSVQKQRQTEPLSCADENRPICSPPQRKHHQRALVKFFKENGGVRHDQSRFQRPDTPTVTTSSKLRLMQQRSTPTMSSAAKLLQTSGISLSHLDNSNTNESPPSPSPSSCSSSSRCDSNQNNDYANTDHLARSCSSQSLPDIRSSMPEVSILPIVPGRLLVDKSTNRPNAANTDSCKPSPSPCSRSLDFPRSAICEYSMIHPVKTPEKTIKQCATSSIKMGGLPLPPVPPYGRKGKKVLSHQEDVHCLRLLHNHYLQWRYVNAKAEASTKAQKRETEKILFSLSIRISELYDLLKCRRVMLSILQRTKALSAVVEPQMPYLEEWSSLEEDYSACLLEAIQALSNVSLRLPISGNIRADVKEVGEAFNSAMKLMELIAFHVQKFIPKAEEMEHIVSELARVAGGERALIEECGDLLFKTHRSQAEECSLQTQLIQLNQICHGQLHCNK
ncbi:protein ENDOSPERM DEFECTIVE 1-like [Euphorbia lathyris]|uniref:protein ENDOSPERM DEFECTIVE 1-like n=1 Tax=Euphorbia lathyris TaxID=212925 RepID=UPI0033141F85